MKKYLRLIHFWIVVFVLFVVYVTAFTVSFWACPKIDPNGWIYKIWCYVGNFSS